MNNVRIVSTGSSVPELIITNDMLSKLVDTSDEWITTRTGIKNRRVSVDKDTSDLATEAAVSCIKKASVKAEEIELIIVATVTPDMFTPSTACIVQNKIGAFKASAFDINAACSGFIYGVDVAKSLLGCGRFRNALVIGAECLSKITNWEDRSTCVLFGDASGAVYMEVSDKPGIMKISTGAEGDKGNSLLSGALKPNNPFNRNNTSPYKDHFVKMNGQEVYRFATRVISESIKDIFEEFNLTEKDIKLIIPHQANLRIIEFASKKLNISIDKFYINLQDYGNTSSASIPLALNEAFEKGMISEGDKVIAVGFGGGLTYGSLLIQF
ncbi:3-oxoacyl-[acyl-carrier-protein] synthase-3 [Clostridium amylolyticum]|uniref:Beta-ketoacyl-[acyl-carrier-protein] synthase III n=1 Tax=Clostridium amylolyticum TaxID=1121298 RepID=A0A1M6CYP0_9CLOT|nr:beta-ketoacyl-ACP synthase III [Clostridium amylolyticum]SHI65838.1 3-oxoacyl-[acyl-carrier-protein] synthase-3 [Clostridium amylolyticum]